MPKSTPLQMIAFLKGVNVGRRKATSVDLVAAFHSIELLNPQTFLASGNVVFETDEKDLHPLAERIENSLQFKLGFSVDVVLRSMTQVHELANANPFQLTPREMEDFTVNVMLFRENIAAKLRKAMQLQTSDYDDFRFASREVFWLCRGSKISNSQLFQKNDWSHKDQPLSTMRNQRTLQRLTAKFAMD